MFGRTPKPATSRQQRRAADVRDADRKGNAAMDAKSRRRTALEADPPPRSWWRSS
ncbi:hypothetical protein ACIRVF_08185 [Kitasatospora sp. NPDC101157]|uniref:hypothetical protein n=1 Tax=Kitasatospora sp. NPDC101157 TaxID=3364098 RepID=UPI00382FDA15